jgi:hypothetical protein
VAVKHAKIAMKVVFHSSVNLISSFYLGKGRLTKKAISTVLSAHSFGTRKTKQH